MTKLSRADYEAAIGHAYNLGRKDAGAAAGPKPVGGIYATPRVRGLARSLGVDLGKVQGTGVAGRITPQDVRAAAPGAPQSGSDDSYPSSWKRPEPGAATTAMFGAPSRTGAADAYPAHWDTSPLGDDSDAPTPAAKAAEPAPRAGKYAGTEYPADWAL